MLAIIRCDEGAMSRFQLTGSRWISDTDRDRSRLSSRPAEPSATARGTADAKLSHPIHQRGPLHPQSLGRAIAAAYDPITRFQRPDDVISLHFLEARHGRVGLRRRVEGLQFGGWGAQNGVRRENDGSLDEVL